MKYLILILCVCFSINSLSQQKFKATYEVVIPLPFNKNKNPEATELDMNIRLQLKLTSNGKYVLMTSSAPKQSYMRFDSTQELFLRNGAWYRYDKKKNKYIKEEDRHERVVSFTGKEKILMGYKVEEATGADNQGNKFTVWICKMLPATILPGILLKNNPGAVFEYYNEGTNSRVTLKSLTI